MGDRASDSAQVATDEAGRYAFEGLADGHAKVHVRSPLVGSFVATFWPGEYTVGQAGVIPVTRRGFVANIDLPPVPIRLHVQVPQISNFLGDGYRSDGSESGRRVDSPGDVTGLVIRLPRGGELSGTVRDRSGRPVAQASVRVENCQYGCPRDATTDESGHYRIRGIAPSTRMIVHAWAPGMIDQWYDRAGDWIAAAPLEVAAGEALTGVDFVLMGGGVLNGQVLAGDTGHPLTGVLAYLKSVRNPSRRYFAYSTDEDPNHYRIGPVPPDAYRLVLMPNGRQTQYRPARWLTASGIATSGIIRFAAGQESAFVVTLARARPDLSDCTGVDRWLGLFRGFLGPDAWPPVSPCAAPSSAPGSTTVRSA